MIMAAYNEAAMAAARRGEQFLDQHWPQWWLEVDQTTLNLASGCDCVLGQLGVDYGAAAEQFHCTYDQDNVFVTDGFNLFSEVIFPHLGLEEGELSWLGFDSDYDEGNFSYDDLTVVWQTILTEKRMAASII